MEIPKTYEPKDCEGRWYPNWEQNRYFTPETNLDPKPFVWTAKAHDILQKVIRANRRIGSKKNEALH